jgi:integrase
MKMVGWCGRRDLNPGSQAWRACVLNQSRQESLRTHKILSSLDHDRIQEAKLLLQINPISTTVEASIINAIIAMRSNGRKENTLRAINYKLRELARNVDLLNPEQVKAYISTAKNQITNQPLSDCSRNKFAYAYDCYCKAQNIQWKKPFYRVAENTPIIPSTENVNAIINNASPKYATIFKILTETGAEGQELYNVTQSDIDAENGQITIRGVKGHGSATYKLKTQTADMLRIYLANHKQEHPFPQSHTIGQVWRDTRERTAKKLCKPELNKIPLKNLRNYSGAMLYYKILDPIAVMRHLRHKKLETTMHYIRGITLNNGDEEYTVKTATNIKEATELLEQGFQYVQDIDGIRLYRKRK